jgi:hypothetical protein
MAIDLSSGMDASSDYFLAAQPEDPQFRESASMWISDDEGVIGLPRVGIEAVSEEWDRRGLQVNLGFPDGRAVIVREDAASWTTTVCVARSAPVVSSSGASSRSRH